MTCTLTFTRLFDNVWKPSLGSSSMGIYLWKIFLMSSQIWHDAVSMSVQWDPLGLSKWFTREHSLLDVFLASKCSISEFPIAMPQHEKLPEYYWRPGDRNQQLWGSQLSRVGAIFAGWRFKEWAYVHELSSPAMESTKTTCAGKHVERFKLRAVAVIFLVSVTCTVRTVFGNWIAGLAGAWRLICFG